MFRKLHNAQATSSISDLYQGNRVITYRCLFWNIRIILTLKIYHCNTQSKYLAIFYNENKSRIQYSLLEVINISLQCPLSGFWKIMAATIVLAISHLSNQLWLLFFNSEMEKQGTRVFFPYKRTLGEKRGREREKEEEERERNSKRLDKKRKDTKQSRAIWRILYSPRIGDLRRAAEMWKNTFPAAFKHSIYSTQNKVENIMTFLSGQLSQKLRSHVLQC